MGILRFILALSVVLDHLQGHFKVSFFNYQIVGGEVAVIAFFIISGFYMSLILNEKYTKQSGSYFLYISNRFLRIYPLYWVILILTCIYFAVTGVHIIQYAFTFHNKFLNGANLAQNIIQNITLIVTPRFLFSFPQLYGNFYVDPAWTLGIEFMFYLIAPFLVKGSMKKILIILFLSLIIRIYTTHLNIFYPVFSLPFFFLPNLFFFIVGAFSYQIYRRIKKNKINKKIYYCITIGTLLFALMFNFIPPIFFYTFKQYVFYFLVFISIPYLFIIESSLEYSFYLGELSYPLYISHMLVLSIVDSLPKLSFLSNWIGTFDILLAIFIAVLLKESLLDPIDRYRALRVKRTKPKTSTQYQGYQG